MNKEKDEPVVKTRKEAYLEFGGSLGVSCNMIMMPLTVYLLQFACNKDSCTLFRIPSLPPSLDQFYDLKASGLVLAWLGFQVLLYLLPVGRIVTGSTLPNGQQLKYRCNGFFAFCASMCALFSLVTLGYDVTYVIDRLPAMITCTSVIAFVLSCYLFSKSKSAAEHELSEAGRTGVPVYGFYLGRELNPRIGPLDLKMFFELRPGLIGWAVLDVIYAIRAYHLAGFVPLPLVMICAFHLLYVVDALYYEDTVLTTLDITTEGFGFMLAFGDTTWVPFVFSLQARFLAFHYRHLAAYWSTSALVIITLTNIFGYYIFRSSNNEKDTFRRDPNHSSVSNMETIPGEAGRHLLVDGWWGVCRHPNYFGDVIMALAWSLTCGLEFILPWYYLLYLTAALVHRTGRDDSFCAKKHGKTAWSKYCAAVKYRMIPLWY